MFAYIELDSFLHRRNPMIKLVVIAFMKILVCLSYYPVFPILTFILAFFTIWIGGRIPIDNLIRRLFMFIVISFLFMLSMLILRGFDNEPGIILTLGILKWTEKDIVHAITLGFRILALVTMSMGFVLTTRPRDLVLSLIMQCKISILHGYATIATYRFLPELQSQVDTIHLAQEIRGIPWNKGIISRFSSSFRVALPLFCVASRRGERIACAMESRGLGRENERTFYKKICIDKTDWIFLAVSVLIYATIAFILMKLDLFKFNIASIK